MRLIHHYSYYFYDTTTYLLYIYTHQSIVITWIENHAQIKTNQKRVVSFLITFIPTIERNPKSSYIFQKKRNQNPNWNSISIYDQIQKYSDCDRCRPARAASVPWLVYLLSLSLMCCSIVSLLIFQLVVLNLNWFFSF